MSSLTGGKTVGDFSTLKADVSTILTGLFGSQLSLGSIGQGGQVKFNRGSDGVSQTNVGYSTSTTATDFNINHDAVGGVFRLSMGGTTPIRATSSGGGSLGIGISATAKLHIAAGISTAGGAPLKFTTSPLQTTPEAGAEEFLSNDRFYTGVDGARRRYAVNGNIIALQPFTVATLPPGVAGDSAYVSDATAPLYGAALTGGGAVLTPVFRNATVWVSA